MLPVADSKVEPLVFSRKGKLGGIHVSIGGRGASPLLLLNLQESL